jgi:anthranilate synthase component 1
VHHVETTAATSATGSPTLFPVWREVLCDGATPVGVFARLRERAESAFLLESVVGGERWARYSFIGVGHRARVTGHLRDSEIGLEITAGPGFPLPEDPGLPGSRGIEALLARYVAAPAPGLPRFWGGLVGVIGHAMVRDFERLHGEAPEDSGDLPSVDLLLTDAVVIFDNLSQKVQVVATACPRDDGGEEAARRSASARVDALVDALRSPPTASGTLTALELHEDAGFEPRVSDAWASTPHPERVRAAKEQVCAGEVFQLVLSQRFDEPRDDLDSLDVYRTLRVTNPSPYMDLPSAVLVGASPEVLVRVDRDDRRVTVRPIAGTRPRGSDPAEDLALERELLADPKERAEHLMLIDLGRNDVGRISEPGTVQVDESFVIERYSRVMHIVSEVSGQLSEGLSAMDALRSAFPAGTLSGAPKVRALELIEEMEPAPRGWYGGAVGYLGYDGGADFAICIRSVVFKDDELRVQAGGGIVYDSDPDEEDRECKRKASAVLRAIAMAKVGKVPSKRGGSE